MKKILTLALAFTTGLSFAQQYNKTYDVNQNFDQLRPSFNIIQNTTGLNESITVSDGTDGLSNYFILTKLDAFGNQFPGGYNVINRAPNDPQEGYLYVEALHETISGDVIVGGYFYDDVTNIILQPFLARFNAMGVMMWHRVYPVNQRSPLNAQLNKVSLCRVYPDLPVENYFFVVAGDSDANPGNEVATNVIKVDGATGNLIFSNKYYPAPVNQFANLREHPGDIEFSPVKRMFMITGHREHTDADGNVYNQMYHFGITNTGAMFTPVPPLNFLTQTSNSIPVDQDMVYDAVNDRFATVFTHDFQGYVAGFQSLIGFVKVDPALGIWNPGLIWHNDADIHNGRSISNSNMVFPNGFAIGAGVHENVNPPFVNNPAFQLVDNIGMPIGNFIRYNIWDDVYFSHHAWKPALDEFVLASEQNTDLRVISTDPTGDDNCGRMFYGPKYQPYGPSSKMYVYRPRVFNKMFPYQLNQQFTDLPYRECFPPPIVNSYRMAGTTGIASFTADKLGLKVYPTVVSRNTAELTIENGSGAEVKVEVRDVTGQLIQTTENVGSGKTTVALNQGLSAGVYMVHFYSADGNISATEKILISE